MDPQRFDQLAKTLSVLDTRRGLLRVLAGAPLAGAVAALLGEPAGVARERRHGDDPRHDRNDGKKKRKGHGKGKHQGQDTDPAQPCGATTCATGCCALGTCVIGEYEICGTGGEVCIGCTAAPGLNCNVGRCECRAGQGCCIRSGVDPRPNPCTDCCSGTCLSGDPINGCT